MPFDNNVFRLHAYVCVHDVTGGALISFVKNDCAVHHVRMKYAAKELPEALTIERVLSIFVFNVFRHRGRLYILVKEPVMMTATCVFHSFRGCCVSHAFSYLTFPVQR